MFKFIIQDIKDSFYMTMFFIVWTLVFGLLFQVTDDIYKDTNVDDSYYEKIKSDFFEIWKMFFGVFTAIGSLGSGIGLILIFKHFYDKLFNRNGGVL